MPPPTHYAKSGDIHLAYQVIGDGPVDIVLAYGNGSNVDVQWEYPRFAAFLDSLAELGRLIIYDKRDTGCSDRTGTPPTLEERVDDILAVMDAAVSERAVLIGMTGGAAPAALLAALHPHRVEALVTYALIRSMEAAEGVSGDMQHGPTPEYLATVGETWGRGITAHIYARSMLHEPGFIEWCARYERSMASPGNAGIMVWSSWAWDLTDVLPTITVPTLAMWRSDDSFGGRAYAETANLIPGARTAELPGRDHWPWVGDSDAVVDAIRTFVAERGTRERAERQLAAVLFTDIVESTQRAAAVGDRQWRIVLDRHDELARTHTERFRGRLVKQTGDGILATFDGPGRAVKCALALSDAMRGVGVEVRAGVHVGEIEPRGDDIGGIAVHLASRVCGAAGASEVLVTRTVRDLVIGSGLSFEDRGEHAFKGVPDKWVVYSASNARTSSDSAISARVT